MKFAVWSILLIASIVNLLRYFLGELPVKEEAFGEVFLAIFAVAISWVMYLHDLWTEHDE